MHDSHFAQRRLAPTPPVNTTDQTGSILILTLVFLLLTTLIGATTFFSSFTETQRAGNYSASTLTLEHTESALRAGETFLLSMRERPNLTPVGQVFLTDYPVYAPNKLTTVIEETARQWPQETNTWWKQYGRTVTIPAPESKPEAKPEPPIVIIEEIDFEPDSATLRTIYGQARTGTVYYRISARGEGKRSSATTLQSLFATRYN